MLNPNKEFEFEKAIASPPEALVYPELPQGDETKGASSIAMGADCGSSRKNVGMGIPSSAHTALGGSCMGPLGVFPVEQESGQR